MVEVSRSKLDHPTLATTGGAALHTSVEALWTKVGDNANSRFFTEDALANTASVDFDHNFYVDFDDLTTILYERNTGTGELIGQLTSGFSITGKAGDLKRQITVTNNSGGPKDIALVVIHGGGAGAGGGGGSLTWNEPSGISPVQGEENGEKVYLYESGLANKLVAFIKIPAGHVASNQITMNIGLYSPSTSNTILLSATTTLIRTGTDGIDSTTNQHSSTNTAVTNTAPANKFISESLDLTDGSGQINGVDAEAGDLLKVELLRGTDTDTADIRFVPNATEVSF